MNQPTVTSFFLGSNSQRGFYSLYDQFCSAPSDILHIIKGGPGTGKSTFMKRMGKAAEERGYDVEYILCSGDPDSLDGVYIPALHTGWADGTAPHVLEPKLFGATGDYVNLGRFCSTPLLKQCQGLIASVTAQYKQRYTDAYTYLQAAGAVGHRTPLPISEDAEQKLRKRAAAKLDRELDKYNTNGAPVKRFLRAISCKGSTILTDTVNTLCRRLCVVESHFGLEQIFFQEALHTIVEHGAACIVCPSPLCPDAIEAILLPNEQLGFIAAQALPTFSGTIRTIHLDSYANDYGRTDAKQREKLQSQLLTAAYQSLSEAKQLHDELETYYRPALDIDALNTYTEAVIAHTFP